MDIDLPDVVAEVRAAFEDYEKALVTNDVAALNGFFHVDPRTIRYGGAEILYGHHEIAAFRAARSPVGLERTLSRTVITAYGRECAVASTLFPNAMSAGARAMGHVYYEAVGVILTLVLLGRYLETRARGRTSAAIRKLLDAHGAGAGGKSDGQDGDDKGQSNNNNTGRGRRARGGKGEAS